MQLAVGVLGAVVADVERSEPDDVPLRVEVGPDLGVAVLDPLRDAGGQHSGDELVVERPRCEGVEEGAVQLDRDRAERHACHV